MAIVFYYDYYSRLIPATEKADSNWSLLVKHPNQSLFLGFLTYQKTTSRFYSTPQNDSLFVEAEMEYSPRLDPPQKTEPFVLLWDDSPFTCLQKWSQLFSQYSTQQGYYGWLEPIPDGWDSYQAGPEYGGYGRTITEQILYENLLAFKSRIAPFGARHFQIGDGWETYAGDWTPDPQRFPKGMAWIASEIKKQGLIPGIEITPFASDKQSSFYQKNKTWFASKTLAGRMGSPADLMILDISNPEVQGFLRQKLQELKSWGFQNVRLNHNYWILLASNFYEKEKTLAQIYQEGIQLLRETLGEDIFLSSSGIAGLNHPYSHALKNTLDLVPRWTQIPELSWKGRGLKETYRSLARRYYFQQGLCLIDPGVLYFRSPLTFGQSLCYLQAVAYCGGLVRLGEDPRLLSPAQLQAFGAVLPAYNQAGTPLDLFEKEYPETWLLQLPGHHHIGLFHWGENLELPSQKSLPLGKRTLSLPLSFSPQKSFHIVEFWSGTYLGSFQNTVSYELAPESVASLTLTPISSFPSLLHSSRHLFLLTPEESCFFEKDQLFLKTSAIAHLRQRWIVFIPSGWRYERVEGLSTAKVRQEGSLLFLENTAFQNGFLTWSIYFEKES
jgi:hypothetical protein